MKPKRLDAEFIGNKLHDSDLLGRNRENREPYSSLMSESNCGEMWNKAMTNDGPISLSEIELLIKAAKAIIISSKK